MLKLEKHMRFTDLPQGRLWLEGGAASPGGYRRVQTCACITPMIDGDNSARQRPDHFYT